MLKELPDLQRLTTRVSTNRASPRDLGGVRKGLRELPKIKAKIAGRGAKLLNELEGRLELCPDLREVLDLGLADELPSNVKDGA